MNIQNSNIINSLNTAIDSGDLSFSTEVIASAVSNTIINNTKSYLIILEKTGHKLFNVNIISLTDIFLKNIKDKKFINIFGYYLARKITKDKIKIKSFVKKFSQILCKINENKEYREYLRNLILLWTFNGISKKEKKFDLTGNKNIKNYIIIIGILAILIPIYLLKKEKINSLLKKIIV